MTRWYVQVLRGNYFFTVPRISNKYFVKSGSENGADKYFKELVSKEWIMILG